MTEEERLEITSVVEDEFSEALERFENALEDADREIAGTGGGGADEVNVDIEVDVGMATAELESIEQKLNQLDDSTARVAVEDQTQSALATSGGRRPDMFTVDNFDLFEDSARPFLDREELGRRGGEVSRIENILTEDLTELVDFDQAVRAINDPDSAVTKSTLQGVKGLDGPDGFIKAVQTLQDENMTRLGDGRSLSQRFKSLNFTMAKFHQVIASVIPLVAVFAGALPAAITGLAAVGVAAIGAAGALAGVGALGVAGLSLQQTGEMSMEPFIEQLDEIGDSFASAFAPLARMFAPTMQDALTTIENMAGPMAQASDGLLDFRDDFQGAIDFFAQALPAGLESTLAFAEAASPILAGIVTTVADANILGFLGKQLAQALPHLIMLSQTIMGLIPAIVHMSQGFLVAANAVAWFIRPVTFMINTFPFLGRVLGLVAGAILSVVAASSLWSIVATGATRKAILFAGVLGKSVVSAAYSAVAGVYSYTNSVLQATAATVGLIGAIGVLTAGLSLLAGGIISSFSNVGDSIGNARKELRRFNQTGTALGSSQLGQGNGLGSGQSSVYQDNSTTIINSGDRDAAARQQYSSQYEHQQHIDSVFGN